MPDFFFLAEEKEKLTFHIATTSTPTSTPTKKKHKAAYMMDANGAKSHAAVRARLEADASDALKTLPSVLQGDRDLPPLPAPGATDELIVNVPDLWSGTDSDVLNLAKRVPFALLHVRHRAGLTHSLAEHAEPSDVASAGLVLHKFLSRQLLGRKEVDFEGKFDEVEGKKKKSNIEEEVKEL